MTGATQARVAPRGSAFRTGGAWHGRTTGIPHPVIPISVESGGDDDADDGAVDGCGGAVADHAGLGDLAVRGNLCRPVWARRGDARAADGVCVAYWRGALRR